MPAHAKVLLIEYQVPVNGKPSIGTMLDLRESSCHTVIPPPQFMLTLWFYLPRHDDYDRCEGTHEG